MAVERSVFKTRTFVCPPCGASKRVLGWDYDPAPSCCDTPMEQESGPNRATAVIGDEIDIIVKHGPCNDDGTPRRYRSRAELKREERRTGWIPKGETPHRVER